MAAPHEPARKGCCVDKRVARNTCKLCSKQCCESCRSLFYKDFTLQVGDEVVSLLSVALGLCPSCARDFDEFRHPQISFSFDSCITKLLPASTGTVSLKKIGDEYKIHADGDAFAIVSKTCKMIVHDGVLIKRYTFCDICSATLNRDKPCDKCACKHCRQLGDTHAQRWCVECRKMKCVTQIGAYCVGECFHVVCTECVPAAKCEVCTAVVCRLCVRESHPGRCIGLCIEQQ